MVDASVSKIDGTSKSRIQDQASAHEAPDTLLEQLRQEAEAMARYASGQGLQLPSDAIRIEMLDPTSLVELHYRLARLVEPATPDILVNATKNKRLVVSANAAPIMAAMFAFSALSVGAFVLSLTHLASESIAKSLVQLAGPTCGGIHPVLWRLLYVLGAAGVGAAFVNLFQIHSYVLASAYDRRYDATYYIKFGVGLLAGLVLSEFLTADGTSGGVSGFGVATVALVGGFAAPVVYRIIKRLTSTLESLFIGDFDERLKAERRAADARAAEENFTNSKRNAALLLELKTDLEALDKEGVNRRIDELMKRFLYGEEHVGTTATAGTGGQG